MAYPGADSFVVKGVSLHAAGGTILCVLGGAASGKTTLLRALSGDDAVTVTNGRITLQGRDQTQYHPSRWRASLAELRRPAGRLQVSAADNVAIGDMS